MTRATLRELKRKARKGQWDDRMLNGHPPVKKSLRPIIIEAYAFGCVVTSTTDGVHAPTSFHPHGRAVDFGCRVGFHRWFLRRLVRLQRRLHKRWGSRLSELFGPNNRANRKWGKSIRLAEGSPLETLHDNHVHAAI